jgi:hypothetical protein
MTKQRRAKMTEDRIAKEDKGEASKSRQRTCEHSYDKGEASKGRQIVTERGKQRQTEREASKGRQRTG